MPSNKIQYTVGISADTSQAKKAINDLLKDLTAVQKTNAASLHLDADIEKAASAAKTLQQHLVAATNVNTGNLNLNQFVASLQQSNQSLSKLSSDLVNAGQIGQQSFLSLAKAIAASEVPLTRVDNVLTRFGQTLKNTVKWQLSSNIVHGLQGALQGAVNYAQNLNETLTDIRIVTGASVDDMAKFAANANRAAKELSTTTKAYADASLIYYQQGDSAELAAKKAATTIKAANVAFTASAKEMSEMLTAVWNSYQVGSDQLEHVVDVMANLGAKTASSMEEMATAMQKVAATANTVGVSMEQMSAIVATSASVTRQAPETVGTAWNTILSRIGGLKLGNTLEDGVNLNKYSSALATVGVNILDVTGELRDMGDVINELGERWETLSRGQKAALAQTIGGARQYTQIMAFFDNFDKYQQNIGFANNSQGALQQQQETYAQGWEAASKRVKASLESIYGALLNDKAMVAMTSGIATFIQGIENAVKGMGGLKGSITAIGGILTNVFSKQIVANIQGTFESLTRVFTNKNNDLDVYKENLQHVKEQLQEIRLTSEGADSTETDNAIKLIELRQQLADQQKNMTTEQVNAAQAIIDSLGNEINYVNQVARAYDEATDAAQKRASAASMNDVFTSLVHGASKNTVLANDQAAYSQTVEGTFNDLYYQNKKINTLSGFGADLTELFTDTTALNSAVSKINEIAASTGSAEEKTQLYIQEIERLKNAFGESSDIGKQLQDVLNNSTTADEFKQGITDIINKLYEMRGIDAGATIEDIIQKIDKAGMMTDELRAYLEGLAESARKAGQQLYATGASAENLNQNLKNAKNSIENLSTQLSGGLQNLTKMASAAMSFASIMRSTESLASNLAKGTGTIATNIGSMAGSLMSFAMLAKTLIPLIGGPAGVAIGIGAAALGIASGINNANKEKDEQRRQELISSSSNKVQSLQDEQKSIDDLYQKYLSLEEARSSSGEVTNEYLNTLDQLLSAIGSESESVLALSGDYDHLAESIKNSYKARMESSLKDQRETLNSQLYASLGTRNYTLAADTDQEIMNVLSRFGFNFTHSSGLSESEFITREAEINDNWRQQVLNDYNALMRKQKDDYAKYVRETTPIPENDIPIGKRQTDEIDHLEEEIIRSSPTRDKNNLLWFSSERDEDLLSEVTAQNYKQWIETTGGRSGYRYNSSKDVWEEFLLKPVYKMEDILLTNEEQYDQIVADKIAKFNATRVENGISNTAIVSNLTNNPNFQDYAKHKYYGADSVFRGELTLDSIQDIEAFTLGLYDFYNSLDFQKLDKEDQDLFTESFGDMIEQSVVDSIKTVKITEGKLALEEKASTDYTAMMNIVAESIISGSTYDTLPQWAQELAHTIVKIYTSGVSSEVQKEITATQLDFYNAHKTDNYKSFFRTNNLPANESEFYKSVGFSQGDQLISDMAERTEVIAVKTLMKALEQGADWSDIEAKAKTAGIADNIVADWKQADNGGIFGFNAARQAGLNYLNTQVASGTYVNKGTNIAESSDNWIQFMENMSADYANQSTGRHDTFKELTKFAAQMEKFTLNDTNNRTIFEALSEDAREFLKTNGLTDKDGNLTDFGKYIVGDFRSDQTFIDQERKKFSNLTSATAALPPTATINTAHNIQWSDDLSKLTKDVSSWSAQEYLTLAEAAFGNFNNNDYYSFDTMSQANQQQFILGVLNKAIEDTFGKDGEKTTNVTEKIAYEQAKAIRDAYERGIDAENFEKKVNPIKNAISALESEINNIVTGKGVSQKSQDILKRAGINIDPSKIKDIKSYTQALTELRNKLQSEFQTQLTAYGQPFDPHLSQKEIDAMTEDEQAAYNRLLQLREDINNTNEAILSSYAAAQQEYTNEVQASIKNMEAEYNRAAEQNERLQTKAETAAQSIGKSISEIQASQMGLNSSAEWSNKTIAEQTQFATQALNDAYLAQSNLLGRQMQDWQSLLSVIDDASKGINIALASVGDSTNIWARDGKNSFMATLRGMFDENQMRALSQAWDKASQKLDFSKMSDKEIWEAIKREAGDALVDVGTDLDKLTAQYKDDVNDIGKTIAEQLQQDADQTVAIWEQAFNTIAGLRKKLFSGENITEDLANDIDAYLLALKSSGLNNEEFQRQVLSGELKGDTLKTPIVTTKQLYDKYGLSMFDTGANAEESLKNFRTNVRQEANAQGVFSYSQIQEIERNELQRLLKSSQASTGYTDTEINSLIDKYLAGDEEAATQILEAAQIMKQAADGQLSLMEANRQQQEQDAAFQNGIENLGNENGKFVDQQEQQQKDLDLLNKARDKFDKDTHGLNEKDFSPEEIQRLEDLTGTAFGHIKLDQLNNASDGAAQELYKLAQAAAAAAQAEAEKAGYKQFDGEWHNTLNHKGLDTNEGLDEESYKDLAYDQQGLYTKADDGLYYLKGQKAEGVKDTLKGFEDTAESASINQAENEAKDFDKLAQSVDMSREEFEDYIKTQKELGKIIGDNDKELAQNAALLARQTKGFDEAQKNMSDYMKTLNKTNKGSTEHSKTLNKVRDVYADLFDLTDEEAKHLSDTFLESTDNAKLLEKAIKGDEKAWDKLTATAAEDIFNNMDMSKIIDPAGVMTDVSGLISEIQSYLNDNNLEVGADLNDAPFMSKLQSMVFKSQDAAQEMTAALSAVGVEAEIVPKTKSVPASTTHRTISGTFPLVSQTTDGSLIKEDIPIQAEIDDTIPAHEETFWVLEGAKYNGRGSANGGASNPKKSGGAEEEENNIKRKIQSVPKMKLNVIMRSATKLKNQVMRQKKQIKLKLKHMVVSILMPSKKKSLF